MHAYATHQMMHRHADGDCRVFPAHVDVPKSAIKRAPFAECGVQPYVRVLRARGSRHMAVQLQPTCMRTREPTHVNSRAARVICMQTQ